MHATHDTPGGACPACRATLDACTGVTTDDPPSAGDLSVCVYCASALELTGDGAWRIVSKLELLAMDGEARDQVLAAMEFFGSRVGRRLEGGQIQ